jgi:hypothetical protein
MPMSCSCASLPDAGIGKAAVACRGRVSASGLVVGETSQWPLAAKAPGMTPCKAIGTDVLSNMINMMPLDD